MKSKRNLERNTRPMTPDERSRFEEDVIHGGDEPAADTPLGEPAPEDQLTKSGRLKPAEVQKAGKKVRR